MEPIESEITSARPGANRTHLRALLIDDSPDDAELLLLELQRRGYVVDWTRVDNAENLLSAISDHEWDIVLSDFSMPNFSGLRALEIVQASGVDIPFIIISGTIGEEAAVEALKAGAHDFLVKGKLARLQPAIDREVRDSTTRRNHQRSESALRESENRFRGIIETAQEGIWMLDADLETVYQNRRMAELLGGTPEQFERAKLTSFLDAENVSHAHSVLTATDGRHRELKFNRPDGGELWASISSTPQMQDGALTGCLLMVTDITEQRKLQLQLMVSDRMASVGLLAAGVAHEINNPLAAVLANVELAQRALDRVIEEVPAADPEEIREELSDAREAALRVKQIVQDLRIFSRSEQEVTAPIDLVATLESTLRMAWNEIRHRATLVKEFDQVPPVEGNKSRLGQVFLNLIVNAAQAIPEGHAQENKIRVRLSQLPDQRLCVSISDTGSGMPPDVLKRLFTPFFTTKPPGVGTGLGLSICHKIVTSLGGSIEVVSQPGKGTTFNVYLRPAHEAIVAASEQSKSVPKLGRRGRILVVDDEPTIGAILRRILSPDHDVEIVLRAAEAAKRIAAGDRFDLILCDLMMPEMTGMELYHTLVETAPAQAKVMVFLTGGAFTPAAQSFFEQVQNRRLDKPFAVADVQAVVQKWLGQNGTQATAA